VHDTLAHTIGILSDLPRPLDLDLPEFDHLELVELALSLVDERGQVCLANFPVGVFLIDLVLVLNMGQPALQLGDGLLLDAVLDD